jgi:hypothetical protein
LGNQELQLSAISGQLPDWLSGYSDHNNKAVSHQSGVNFITKGNLKPFADC